MRANQADRLHLPEAHGAAGGLSRRTSRPLGPLAGEELATHCNGGVGGAAILSLRQRDRPKDRQEPWGWFSTASVSNIPALARLKGCGDLAGEDTIQPSHIAEATDYRRREKA